MNKIVIAGGIVLLAVLVGVFTVIVVLNITTTESASGPTIELETAGFQQSTSDKINEKVNFKTYFVSAFKLRFIDDNSTTTNVTRRTKRAFSGENIPNELLKEVYGHYQLASKSKEFIKVAKDGITDEALELIASEIWSRVGKKSVEKIAVAVFKKGGKVVGGNIGGALGMAIGTAIPPLQIPLTIGGVFIGKNLGQAMGTIAGKVAADMVNNLISKLIAEIYLRPMYDLIEREMKELSTSPEVTCRSDICTRGFAEKNCKCVVCNGTMEYSDIDGLPTCKTCPLGSVPKKIGYTTSCTLCPKATFGKSDGICHKCSGAMQYSDVRGATSCKTCTLGSYQRNSIGCVKCQRGTFGNNDGCHFCNGTMEYGNEYGVTSCKTCPIGSYPSKAYTAYLGKYYGKYFTDCTKCQIGTFGKNDGVCYACNKAMQYGDVEGATSCKTCSLGSIPRKSYNGRYNTSCTLCREGTFGKNDGICHKCSGAMQYSGVKGATSCKTCPLGSIPINSKRCDICREGTFGKNDGICHLCNGTMQYSDITGATSCKTCSLGSYPTIDYIFNPGGKYYNKCVKCGIGTYGENDGICYKCKGTMQYSDVKGATSCKTCPPGTYAYGNYRCLKTQL